MSFAMSLQSSHGGSRRPSGAGWMLQRKCDCGSSNKRLQDMCKDCRAQTSRTKLSTKLSMAASNSPLEAEADKVANDVMSPSSVPRPGRALTAVQRNRAPSTVVANAAPPSVERALSEAGRPLEPGVREDMESRFGYDFSDVRIHLGTAARRSAREIDAQAYTVDRSIVFAKGHYAPTSISGRRLLAHELTHVVQQGGRAFAGREVLRRPREHGFGDDFDPLHAPLINDFRRRHGLPPGGRDETGARVGPSDAQIKYQLLPQKAQGPVCPDISLAEHPDFADPKQKKAFRDISCLSAESQNMPARCRFSPKQEKALKSAQETAKSRVDRGLAFVNGGKKQKELVTLSAEQSFEHEPPDIDDISSRMNKVTKFLGGSTIRFQGRTCGDPACADGITVAYVTGPKSLPIHICPLGLSRPGKLARTVLHEALHWSGLDADPATPEGYCENEDCAKPCLSKEDADGWTHFIDCLGKPIQLRRDFVDKMTESVNDLP